MRTTNCYHDSHVPDIHTLQTAIANRDTSAIIAMMFEDKRPRLKRGFYKEDDLWDFKEDIPPIQKSARSAWAKIAAHVLAFHNHKGGVLIFGISDASYSYTGCSEILDTKRFNDKIRRYCGDRFWVSFSREFIGADQRYLGVAVITPRSHTVLYALADSPSEKTGEPYLKKGDLCIRTADQTRILTHTARHPNRSVCQSDITGTTSYYLRRRRKLVPCPTTGLA